MKLVSLLIVASLATLGVADLYCHNPRASNNRLNEKSANRDNGDRLFDSQNNNRGGYNVGEHGVTAFSGNNPYLSLTDMLNDVNYQTTGQYSMVYYEGSVLPLEWTNQHGCGGNGNNDPNKLNCNMVAQYTCETKPNAFNILGVRPDYAMRVYLRDGGNTNTPDEPNTFNDVSSGATQQSNDQNQRGRHESEGWYFECKNRQRNKGLFTADQNLNENAGARATRQNPNGNRRGLECPEERDYYPYWVPDPWIDIAYLTDRLDLCPMIQANSMNFNRRSKCVQAGGGYDQTGPVRALTQNDCTNANGVWLTGAQGITHGLPQTAANTIRCEAAEWTRDNHLGNTRFAQPWMVNWTLPSVSDLLGAGNIQEFTVTGDAATKYVKCVFRLRYNLTTDDYDPWNTTASSNQGNGVQSPVTQNPTVDVGAQDLQGLALAINTNQFGRTFQDRSHVFYIKQRPAASDATSNGLNTATIYNLNVRGKRGNIVQTYPAVEYDFIPNIMTVTTNDFIHFQWTGSNTHNNGDPGGDGQTGDAGEGTVGTDRHSWAESGDSASNYPLPLDMYGAESLLLGPSATPANTNSECYDIFGRHLDNKYPDSNGVNCALTLATSGQIRQVSQATTDFDPLLNDAPASLIGGVLLKPNAGAVPTSPHNYIDTRNNNFSNRSTKGSITVKLP